MSSQPVDVPFCQNCGGMGFLYVDANGVALGCDDLDDGDRATCKRCDGTGAEPDYARYGGGQ